MINNTSKDLEQLLIKKWDSGWNLINQDEKEDVYKRQLKGNWLQ